MPFTKNIDQCLKDKKITTEIKNLLKQALLRLEKSQKYVKGIADQSVAAFNNEEIQIKYVELSNLFSFVKSFTVGEFVAFAEEYSKVKASKTKRPRGRPKKTEDDHAVQIQKDVQTVAKCYPGLRKNMLTAKIEYLDVDKNGKEHWKIVQGNDIQEVCIDLSYYHGIFIPKDRARDAFSWVAKSNPYSPTDALMDRARSCYPDMSYEEAKQYLSNIGTYLCGAIQDEPVVEGKSLRDQFLARYFIGVAYNARHPGVNISWLPILIGPQGCGKSLLARHLVPEDTGLFHEVTGSMDVLMKETYRLHNGMILELPEVNEYFQQRRAIENLKKLITLKSDQVRFPYEVHTTDLLRTFAFIGTANVADIFQDGSDEGERRYLPITIPEGFKTPWRELRDGENLKIWAAADIMASVVNVENQTSEKIFGFTSEEMNILYAWQKNYSAHDPWESAIYSYISPRAEFTPSDVLTHALDIQPAAQTGTHIRRLNSILRRKFSPRLKYQAQARRNGKRVSLWAWQEQAPLEDQFDGVSQSLQQIDSQTPS